MIGPDDFDKMSANFAPAKGDGPVGPNDFDNSSTPIAAPEPPPHAQSSSAPRDVEGGTQSHPSRSIASGGSSPKSVFRSPLFVVVVSLMTLAAFLWVFMAHIRRDTPDSAFIGAWSRSSAWDANYSGSAQRYHAVGTYSVEISSVHQGLGARWHERREERNIDGSGALAITYEAIFDLRSDGTTLAGSSTSARIRFGNGAWQDLKQVPFTGRLLKSGELQFEIVWQRDRSGTPNNLSSNNLRRVLPPRAPKSTTTFINTNLGGTWTLHSEWGSKFSDSKQRYRASASYAAEVQPAGHSVHLVLREFRDVYYIDDLNVFTLECAGDFSLIRKGNMLTGKVNSASIRTDGGKWHELRNVRFTSQLLSPNQLQFEVIWQGNDGGREITDARGVLSR